MNETVQNKCLELIKLGFKVRAWIKPQGLFLRVRKDKEEKWMLIVDNKVAAVI